MSNKKILILEGGNNEEHDVSLVTSREIQKILNRNKLKFKILRVNPKNLHAAKLIEEAGCKGTNYGDAYVSDKHANFLINRGSASATDIENLGKSIVEKVYTKFNVKLEWEVKIIGE